MKVLVLNSGSSSLKFKVFLKEGLTPVAKGIVEEIGERQGSITFYASEQGEEVKQKVQVKDHFEALGLMTELLQDSGVLQDISDLFGIGHRVVHGGELFTGAVTIDKDVISAIRSLFPLAPLHNPPNLLGIEVALQHAPKVPQVAVFDTAFHQSMPAHAFRYALGKEFYIKHGVRRYGFHGTSYTYVTRVAAEFLSLPLDELSCICLHLGNGASVAGVKNGQSIDTSMGLTPLEGLIMGTRCGDLDPAIVIFLGRQLGFSLEEIDELLNKKSGLLGLCGASDMRVVQERAAQGDKEAQLALDMFCYRIKKYIGGYLGIIGELNAIIFTGGIGEHSALVRQKVCQGLEHLGVIMDHKKNLSCGPGEVGDFTGENGPIRLLVVPTDEELEIARQTVEVLKESMPDK